MEEKLGERRALEEENARREGKTCKKAVAWTVFSFVTATTLTSARTARQQNRCDCISDKPVFP